MVILLAGVAAVVSYRHAYEVVIANGESGWVAYLVPLTIDGLIFASSMVLLDTARRGGARPVLAYLTLALGILATLAANVMHGWAHGPIGAVVAAWPAVALVLSYELLMGLIRRSAVTPQVQADAVPVQVTAPNDGDTNIAPADLDERTPEIEVQPDLVPEPDVDAPYRPVAVATFLSEVAQGEPPSVRTIKDRLNVGTDRARRLQAYLGGLVDTSGLANSN
ncbi:DUF2637 domain-containing protein [Nonomuraea deserti]|uniref:DUF2637 domain-containing protein n=1 Tax=Nonomuraea deserti TaxID=1848322 RepID=A0A4V2Y968_9ACTN|nr:DUF2637 domain-containing protein [Nonomuraea deserti]